MTAKIALVCPKKIKTYYYDELKNEKYAKDQLHFMRGKQKGKTISLVVEETPEGEYVLIERFLFYSALIKAQPYDRVPCLIYPNTDEKARLLHILAYCIYVERKTTWIFKNEIIMQLIEKHNMSESEIAQATNIELKTVKYHILDRRIPCDIRKEANNADAKSVLDKICKSTIIPNEVKEILYRKSIIDSKNPSRLTNEKFKYMQIFHKANNVPPWLLQDSRKLESLIDWLLVMDFKLETHMRNLLISFIIPKRTTYQLKLSKKNFQMDEKINHT